MYAGPLRLLRALAVSAPCVVLSLAAHVAGGGAGPGPVMSPTAAVGIVVVAIAMTLGLVAASAWRWTLGRALVALAMGQAVLHVAFTTLLGTHQVAGPGLTMMLAHGGAALLVGAAIAANDSALAAFFALDAALLRALGAVSLWRHARRLLASLAVPAGMSARRWARRERPRILTDCVVLQCLSRRGPPAVALSH